MAKQATRRLRGYHIAFGLVALVVGGLWAAYAVLQHQFRMDHVPAELNPRSIEWSRTKSDTPPFILTGGGQDLALIVYRMDQAEAEGLKREGLAGLRTKAEAAWNRPDRNRDKNYCREWLLTPAIPVDTRIRQDDEPPLPPLKVIKASEYLYDWTGEPWPPRIINMVDGMLASPGNFWCEARLGYLVVSPGLRKIVFFMYG